MQQIILITGASSGFGALSARALAHAGHTVYASMRDIAGRNAPQPALLSDNLCDCRLRRGLDVVVHNAGHMSYGPAEAFRPEQFSQLFDINVLGTQRVNRAALPYLRQQRKGLVLWVGSSSTRGGKLTATASIAAFAAK